MKNAKALSAALLVTVAVFLGGCSKLPDDGANAKMATVTHLNKVRYLEVFVIGGNGITGKLIANVYNTSLKPGFDGDVTKDSAPQAWAEGLNTEEIKKQNKALAASINGPKLWMIDYFDIPTWVDRVFNGQTIP